MFAEAVARVLTLKLLSQVSTADARFDLFPQHGWPLHELGLSDNTLAAGSQIDHKLNGPFQFVFVNCNIQLLQVVQTMFLKSLSRVNKKNISLVIFVV